MKTLKPPITSRIVTNATTGRIAGSETARNRRQALAPSTAAASRSSLGTACSAARKITIDQPMPFQTPRTLMTASAVHRSPSQLMFWSARWTPS